MLVVLQERTSPLRGEAAGGPVTEPRVRPLRTVLQFSVYKNCAIRASILRAHACINAHASVGILARIAQRFRLNLITQLTSTVPKWLSADLLVRRMELYEVYRLWSWRSTQYLRCGST